MKQLFKENFNFHLIIFILLILNAFNSTCRLDKEKDSFRFLAQANSVCEWIWKVYFVFGMVGFATSALATSMVSVLICWINHGTFDVNYIYFPFRIVWVHWVGFRRKLIWWNDIHFKFSFVFLNIIKIQYSQSSYITFYTVYLGVTTPYSDIFVNCYSVLLRAKAF